MRTVIAFTLGLTFAAAAQANDIEHAMGITTAPDAPLRIITLTNESTEAVLALGVTPVGAVRSWYGDPWYPHLGDMMDAVQDVGTELAVNVELVAGLEPDLIIGSKKRDEEIYPQLSAIAPTVVSLDNRDWQANLGLFASALGRDEQADDLLASYSAEIETLRAALADHANDTVSVVRFVPGQIYLYQQDSFSGLVLDDLGFNRPSPQDQDGLAMAVGSESIPDMDADRLFYLTYDTGDGKGEALEAETLANPLWTGLPVVADGRAHRVDDGVWATAGGIFAARELVGDIAVIYGIDR
ncbi:ABC transporter substrate-binding protein [Qingshengfaniella alkalisoli]|uniref:Iron-siderophore ABC transporter substrate-binding protein n=1 Tax=Qingshengfaniella alkalisoli TaxID=2599296 RepID=A0A5B8IAF5_9RHOB|nr:iron-siderophore ABC transporter substrate-binding protein [Qingshengfaniella alkalisoli]QDY71049.1 iron-siderophore ABC transporter substrate-binding protein [Qingshengfaniella alkalisoli]